MNAFFLFLIGIDWSALIILFIILGLLVFFPSRFLVRTILKFQPERATRISITLTAGVLISIGIFVLWTYSSFSDFNLPSREIFFSQPQPVKQNELQFIPESLRGTYFSIVDSSYLIISEKEIVSKRISNSDFAVTELDSVDRINLRDTIYRDGNGSMTVTVRNDSIFQRAISFDTLYASMKKYILKENKGYYFLNKSIGSKWTVQTLQPLDNELLLSSLRSDDELEKIERNDITETDTINFRIPQNNDEVLAGINAPRAKTRFVRVENP